MPVNRSGAGTGKAVGEFTFSNWNLSAGKEGRYNRKKDINYGGGGGGILVNGVEPKDQHNQFQGEGFGGGGSGLRGLMENHRGINGVILVEVEDTQQ